MQPLSKPLSRGPEVKAMLRGFRVNFTVVVQGSLWEIHQSTNRGRRGSLSTLSSSMSHVPSISCHLHLFFMHFLPLPPTASRSLPSRLHFMWLSFTPVRSLFGVWLSLPLCSLSHTLSLSPTLSPSLTNSLIPSLLHFALFFSLLFFSLPVSVYLALFSLSPLLLSISSPLSRSLSLFLSPSYTSSSFCHLPLFILLSSWGGVLLSVRLGMTSLTGAERNEN